MIVADMIETLKKLPPEAEVVNYQYEYDEYLPVDQIKCIKVNKPADGEFISMTVDKNKEMIEVVRI